MFLLNLRLPLKTATSSPKLEKLSLAVWSLMSPWRKIATKIGPFQVFERTNSFPEIQTYFRVAKTALDLCTSKFLLCRFWSKNQNKLWRRNFVQSTYLVIVSDWRIRKISDSWIFGGVSSELIMWSSNDLSLIRADWFSFRGLWQTPIVLELFKPAEFGKEPSNLSMKLACYVLDEDIFYSPSLDGCWPAAKDYFLEVGSGSFKRTSVSNDVLLVAVKCEGLSSESVEWHFLLFDAGDVFDLLKGFFCSVI